VRVEHNPTYILHIRPFKDSSAIIDCFSQDFGLISLVAKGAKRPRSHWRGFLQPFVALKMSWLGRSELKTLTDIEAETIYPKLVGEKILIGLYLNELLIRLLHRCDAHPALFDFYDKTIGALALADSITQQMLLRQFELTLLSELGYGLDLRHIMPDLLYAYDSSTGIYENAQPNGISGATIIALRENQVMTENQLREAKKLMRIVLNYYLGNKPLQSRKLFQVAYE